MNPDQNNNTQRDWAKVKIFAGSIHPQLCESIARHIGIPISTAKVSAFSNGETRIEVAQSCRGCHAYVIQPMCASEDGKLSVNDAIMELLVFTSALKRASAKSVTIVTPVYGYARQDKKDKSRASITARLVADLLEAAGIDRMITVDLHSSQIEGFFSKPVDNVHTQSVLIRHIQNRWKENLELQQKKKKKSSDVTETKEKILNELMVVSPDAGGAKRALEISKQLKVGCAIMSKERTRANKVENMILVGQVKDKICILVDDMADTCGTLIMAAEKLKEEGAKEVHSYVVHGVFSGSATKKLNACDALLTIVATNTLPLNRACALVKKLSVIDVSPLLASAIQLIHTHQSLSSKL